MKKHLSFVMLTLFTFALAAVCLRAQDGHSADEAAIRENLKWSPGGTQKVASVSRSRSLKTRIMW
jgi:hypothetical protein